MRRILIAILLNGALVLGATAQSSNLLLIMVDDLGYGDLGSFGHPVIDSPHLDQLAAEGISPL